MSPRTTLREAKQLEGAGVDDVYTGELESGKQVHSTQFGHHTCITKQKIMSSRKTVPMLQDNLDKRSGTMGHSLVTGSCILQESLKTIIALTSFG
eukprot:2155271-Amphidinium_carterae.1